MVWGVGEMEREEGREEGRDRHKWMLARMDLSVSAGPPSVHRVLRRRVPERWAWRSRLGRGGHSWHRTRRTSACAFHAEQRRCVPRVRAAEGRIGRGGAKRQVDGAFLRRPRRLILGGVWQDTGRSAVGQRQKRE